MGLACGLLWQLGCRAGESLSPNHNWGDRGKLCMDRWPTFGCSVISVILKRPLLLAYLNKQGQWHCLVFTWSTFCWMLGSGFASTVLWLHPPPHHVAHVPWGCWGKQPTLSMWMGVTVTRELLRIKHKYFCCMHWPLLSDGEGEMLLFGDLRSLLRLLGRWMGWDPISWVVSQVKLGARSLGSALSQMWFRPQRYLK